MRIETLKEDHTSKLTALSNVFKVMPHVQPGIEVKHRLATYNGVGLSYKDERVDVRIGAVYMTKDIAVPSTPNFSSTIDLEKAVQAFLPTVKVHLDGLERKVFHQLSKNSISKVKLKWIRPTSYRGRGYSDYERITSSTLIQNKEYKRLTAFYAKKPRYGSTKTVIIVEYEGELVARIPYQPSLPKLTRPPAWTRELNTNIDQLLRSCRKLKISFEEFYKELKDEIFIRQL